MTRRFALTLALAACSGAPTTIVMVETPTSDAAPTVDASAVPEAAPPDADPPADASDAGADAADGASVPDAACWPEPYYSYECQTRDPRLPPHAWFCPWAPDGGWPAGPDAGCAVDEVVGWDAGAATFCCP